VFPFHPGRETLLPEATVRRVLTTFLSAKEARVRATFVITAYRPFKARLKAR
jgi:hypothetical protein